MNLFQCTVLNCKLTEKACGKRYSKANTEGYWKTENPVTYAVCKNCTVGAKNLEQVPEDERGLVFKKNAPGAPVLRDKLRRHT